MSAFDDAFAPHLARFYDAFGDAVTYHPAEGAPVTGVALDTTRDEDGYDPGGGMARMKTEAIIGRVQASVVPSPKSGEVFEAAGGERLQITGAARLDDGEWVMSLAKVGPG